MRRQRILSKMKRVEIIVEAERLETLTKMIAPHATGYTLIPGATGLGEHGLRDGNLVILVTVVTADHLNEIIDAVMPSIGEHAKVLLITDVTVLRAEHFIPEVRAAVTRAGV